VPPDVAKPSHRRAAAAALDAPRRASGIRPDAARFLPPGMDPADVFPALAHKRAVADAAFDAEIERSAFSER